MARGPARGEVQLYAFALPDKHRRVVVLDEADGMQGCCAVNPHNAAAVAQQRLGKRVARLSSQRMNEICRALRFTLGCEAP